MLKMETTMIKPTINQTRIFLESNQRKAPVLKKARTNSKYNRRQSMPATHYKPKSRSDSKSKTLRKFSVSIFGTGRVGKTSLLSLCKGKSFNPVYTQTIEDTTDIEMELDNEKFILSIDDHMGDYNNTNLIYNTNIASKHGFIVVYDITNRSSFEEADRIIDILRDQINCQTDKIPIMFIANKIDLEHKRQVASHEGQQLCQNTNLSYFEEVSAKDLNNSVPELFIELSKRILKNNPKKHLRRPSLSGRHSRQDSVDSFHNSNNFTRNINHINSADRMYRQGRIIYQKSSSLVSNNGYNLSNQSSPSPNTFPARLDKTKFETINNTNSTESTKKEENPNRYNECTIM